MSKYSDLPDIDTGADVFESVVVNVPEKSISVEGPTNQDIYTSSTGDVKSNKKVFESTVVGDNSNVDFSFRVGKSSAGYTIKNIPETLEQRLARLSREVQEVKDQVSGEQLQTVYDMESTLKQLSLKPKVVNEEAPLHEKEQSVTDKSRIDPDKLTDIESRINALEKIYGSTKELDMQTAGPILTQVKQLRQKLAILAMQPDAIATIETNLEKVSEHVDKIKKSSAKVSYDISSSSGLVSLPEAHQIRALFKRLPVIDEYKSRLPEILDRLRVLTQIHRDAAAVTDIVRDLEHTINVTQTGFDSWRETLLKVEEAVCKHEEVNEKNRKIVEKYLAETL